jgi:acetoin utilization deacetylase AcuC-like enzyme
MLTIYTKTYSVQSVMENSDRINIPVEYLKQNNVKIISSDNLSYSGNNLLVKYNSVQYIKKFNINSDETACNFCSCINPINEKYCYMCANEFNKEIRLYFGKDKDTLITLDTFKELEETSKVLQFLVDKFIMYKYAYALIRPPGHHAYTNHHEGFCIVNNAYILARELLENKKSKSVLIYDWDLHHGNGTQECVLSGKTSGSEDASNVYFVSTHYFARGFYPGTGGDYLFDPDELESGNISNVYNFPLNKSESKNFSEYFKNNIIPLLDVLCNVVDTIIISNGLDAHISDPFAKLCFTDEDYVYMTNYFKSKNKKIIFLLEGGYDPEIIASISLKLISLFD